MSLKVSLIIPVYNTSKYLDACIQSVMSQSHKNIEIICVNDCSTDDSVSILNGYASQDGRIKILHHDVNRGLPATRNTGVSHATGEYIRHVDSDDVITKTSTEDMLVVATSNGSEIVVGNANRIWGNRVYKEARLRRFMSPKSNITLQEDINLWQSFGDVWLYLFQVDFIKKHQLSFHEKIQFGEDQIYGSSVLAKAKKISYCNKIVYLYRENPDSMSNNYPISKLFDEFSWPLLVKYNLSSFPDVYRYNIMFGSVYRLEILENGIENLDREKALDLISKASDVYKDISFDYIYSSAAESTYSMHNVHSIHMIVLLKTVSDEFVYEFYRSGRANRFPVENIGLRKIISLFFVKLLPRLKRRLPFIAKI